MSTQFYAYQAYEMAKQLWKGRNLGGLDDYLIQVGVNSKVRSILKIYHKYFPCVCVKPTIIVGIFPPRVS